MASRNFDATLVPRSLETALGLSVGDTCWLQNLSPTATLLVRQAAVTPAATARAHQIFAGEDVNIQVDAGSRIWAWTDDPDGCPCILTNSLD